MAGSETTKTLAIETEDAVLGPDPQKPSTVLVERGDDEIGQSLLNAIALKAVLLRAEERKES